MLILVQKGGVKGRMYGFQCELLYSCFHEAKLHFHAMYIRWMFIFLDRKAKLSDTHRVPMQHLQMSNDNQEMVRDMLSTLHVGELDFDANADFGFVLLFSSQMKTDALEHLLALFHV